MAGTDRRGQLRFDPTPAAPRRGCRVATSTNWHRCGRGARQGRMRQDSRLVIVRHSLLLGRSGESHDGHHHPEDGDRLLHHVMGLTRGTISWPDHTTARSAPRMGGNCRHPPNGKACWGNGRLQLPDGHAAPHAGLESTSVSRGSSGTDPRAPGGRATHGGPCPVRNATGGALRTGAGGTFGRVLEDPRSTPLARRRPRWLTSGPRAWWTGTRVVVNPRFVQAETARQLRNCAGPTILRMMIQRLSMVRRNAVNRKGPIF